MILLSDCCNKSSSSHTSNYRKNVTITANEESLSDRGTTSERRMSRGGTEIDHHHIMRGGRRKRIWATQRSPSSSSPGMVLGRRRWGTNAAIILLGWIMVASIRPMSSSSLLAAAPATTQSVDFSSIISASYLHTHTDYVFKFDYTSYNVTIPENSMGKTYVQQLADDMGRMGVRVLPGIDVKYRIVSGDKEKLFKVDERIVGDFAFLTVRTRTGNVILNREKVEEYRLAVKAVGTRRDEKNTKLVWEGETMINVRVLDRNDLSPLFYPTEYSATVPEDMALHRNILQVHAEDADLGINGEIYYSFYDKHLYEHLTEDTSSPGSVSDDRFSDLDQFAIHPISGVITLTRPLNFIDRPFYELLVIATDRGVHAQPIYKRISHASKALIRINVTQVSAPEHTHILMV